MSVAVSHVSGMTGLLYIDEHNCMLHGRCAAQHLPKLCSSCRLAQCIAHMSHATSWHAAACDTAHVTGLGTPAPHVTLLTGLFTAAAPGLPQAAWGKLSPYCMS